MNLSAKAEYACLAAIALARHDPDQTPVRAREIAERFGISERFLVQILLQLKAAGLVVSTRGSAGGYRLARPADSISLGEVLTSIDGPFEPLRDAQEPAAQALAAVVQLVRDAERAVLDRTTIAHLAERTRSHDWII